VVAQFTCPACGEKESLSGARQPDGIYITCGTCGHEWLRDVSPRCAACGGTDIVRRPQTMTQLSRGTQLSVVGWRDILLCTSCDRDAVLRSTQAGAPLPADYRSRAVHGPDAGSDAHSSSSSQPADALERVHPRRNS
jgi:hypothetical protein